MLRWCLEMPLGLGHPGLIELDLSNFHLELGTTTL
jgi:hypothetical protein